MRKRLGALIKMFAIDRLSTIKISFVRVSAQGGIIERDMHSGQQYVRLLDLALDSRARPHIGKFAVTINTASVSTATPVRMLGSGTGAKYGE
jgi:hypothetical protein